MTSLGGVLTLILFSTTLFAFYKWQMLRFDLNIAKEEALFWQNLHMDSMMEISRARNLKEAPPPLDFYQQEDNDNV